VVRTWSTQDAVMVIGRDAALQAHQTLKLWCSLAVESFCQLRTRGIHHTSYHEGDNTNSFISVQIFYIASLFFDAELLRVASKWQ